MSCLLSARRPDRVAERHKHTSGRAGRAVSLVEHTCIQGRALAAAAGPGHWTDRLYRSAPRYGGPAYVDVPHFWAGVREVRRHENRTSEGLYNSHIRINAM